MTSSSTCYVNVVWAELGHSHFTLGENNVGGVVTQEMALKMKFQRKLPFSNQFSDYSATKEPVLFLDAFYYKVPLRQMSFNKLTRLHPLWMQF